MHTHNGIVYNANWLVSDPHRELTRPVRVLFLTSVRDVGTCDRNGLTVETPEGPVYMEGVIERAINETRPGGCLHNIIEVAGIITDDVDDGETGDYPTLPTTGKPWIHPLGLKNPDGTRIVDITWNLPTWFRKQPQKKVDVRAAMKKGFEYMVAELLRLKADLVISDHYMARIEYLIDGLGLFGKVLNIHPAITLEDHPYWFPGKTPTADAIAAAGRNDGTTFTGATLHFMDRIIDHGPAIAYQCVTPVYASDQLQQLRARNYPVKCEVFVKGMIHYATNFYPYLDRIDFDRFENRYRLGRK